MDLRRSRVYRRSNAGLVLEYYKLLSRNNKIIQYTALISRQKYRIKWALGHYRFKTPHILIPMHADMVLPWTIKRSTFICWWGHWSSASYDLANGTGFYKLLSVFSLLYTLHMSQLYMPTFVNHRNNSNTLPINPYLVRLSTWDSLHQSYICAG